jgi:hypothetical protein
MADRLQRFLLAASAGMLALGGLMHARAYGKAAAAVASSSLPVFYGNSLKALWLTDSATLLVLSALLGLLAARPAMASGAVIALLALIPGATAGFLYMFMGTFLPAHILLAAAMMTMGAGVSAGRRTMR